MGKWLCKIGLHRWGFRLVSVQMPLAISDCSRCGRWHYISYADGWLPRSNPPPSPFQVSGDV